MCRFANARSFEEDGDGFFEAARLPGTTLRLVYRPQEIRRLGGRRQN
jgi:hypothetical protein